MSMKKATIMIEDTDGYKFRIRLEEVLNRYDEDRIFNIDTGVVHNKYDSQGCPSDVLLCYNYCKRRCFRL